MDYDVICGLYNQPCDGELATSLTAYHITPIANVSSVLAKGLVAKECQATTNGDIRPQAVYLFASDADCRDPNVLSFLFGNRDDLAVIKATIPSSHYNNMQYDGIFNMACICKDGSYPTAIRYTDDIPPSWLTA